MNQTKHQHFISQAEQRLNAHNPSASTENQRIYEFEIVDREKHVIRLSTPRGRSIERNLSMLDLFTFDTDKDRDLRMNFEEVFGRYERLICENTNAILQGHTDHNADLKAELFIGRGRSRRACFGALRITTPAGDASDRPL